MLAACAALADELDLTIHIHVLETRMQALSGMKMQTPFGDIVWRPIDHQSTMGAYVGQLAKKGGKGVMTNWRYADGAKYQPSEAEVHKLRKAD